MSETTPALPVLSCDGCSACCLHMVRPPFYVVDDPEWDRLQAERPDLVAELAADRLAWPRTDEPRPCLWLDAAGRRCKHYEYRPAVCADFEVGEEDCLEHRRRCGVG